MNPKGGKVVKGYVSNPNKDPLYHAVEPLPEVTVRGIDRRGEKYAREGINKFARDYMVPAVSAIASFTPMAIPMAAGQVAGAYTGNTSDAEKRDALINAGLELVPTGLSLLGKGISKGYKSLRKPLSIVNKGDYSANSLLFPEGNQAYSASSVAPTVENLTTDITTKAGKIAQYNQDVNKVLWDAYSDKYTRDYVKSIDKDFGTHYLDTYKKIIRKDRSSRSNILSWITKKKKDYQHEFAPLDVRKEGRTALKENASLSNGKIDIKNMIITFDPDKPYNPRLANHEYAHLVDADNLPTGSLQKESNPYLEWLMDRGNRNTMGEAYQETNYAWNISAPHFGQYTKVPSELKAYMLGFKRNLVNKGILKDIMEPVADDNILKDLFYKYGESFEKDLFHSYKNKKNLLDRFNNLTPLSIFPATIDYRKNKKK